jgi:hypothetical protein
MGQDHGLRSDCPADDEAMVVVVLQPPGFVFVIAQCHGS